LTPGKGYLTVPKITAEEITQLDGLIDKKASAPDGRWVRHLRLSGKLPEHGMGAAARR
jgi:hypothetical protein